MSRPLALVRLLLEEENSSQKTIILMKKERLVELSPADHGYKI